MRALNSARLLTWTTIIMTHSILIAGVITNELLIAFLFTNSMKQLVVAFRASIRA